MSSTNEEWWSAHNGYFKGTQSPAAAAAPTRKEQCTTRVLSRRILTTNQSVVPLAPKSSKTAGSSGRRATAGKGPSGSCPLCRLSRKDWPFCGVNGERHHNTSSGQAES